MTPYRKEVIGGCTQKVTFQGFPNRVQIYAIVGVETVYIGSTSMPIKTRVRSHILDAQKGSDLPIHKWIRAQDYVFTVRLLEEVHTSERAAAERRHIAECPHRLLNLTDGGPGMSGHKFAGSDHARGIAAALRTGAHFSCEVCGEEFWRKRRDIAKGDCRFCSRACYHAWQRGKPKKRGGAHAEV